MSLAIIGNQGGVVLQFDDVVCVGIVGVCPEAHAILQHLVEAYLKFETVVLDFSLVDVRGLGSTVV